MIAAAVMAMVVAGTVPGATLDVTSVDASAFPTVVIDFVVPEPYSALDLTTAMVDVDGAPVEAVVRVDPGDVVVRLVVDDRPEVPADVVGAAQGGAVELVRNTAVGTAIAVGTPSGLQTAATTDPGATIARIAAITAGAPSVTPLPELILASAAAHAADGFPDPQLVVVLGGPLAGTEAQVAEIADLVVANGITLHLLSAADAPEPALTLIAEQSGGTVAEGPEALGFFDAVTAAISNRYRITTTLPTSGEHVVGLRIDGPPITAVVDVQPPAVASEPPAVASEAPALDAVPSTTLELPDVAAAGPVPTTPVVAADGDTTVPDDADEPAFGLIAVALQIAMVGVVAVWAALYWRRRWRRRGLDADPPISVASGTRNPGKSAPSSDSDSESATPAMSSQPRPAERAKSLAEEPPSARDLSPTASSRPQPARKRPTRTTPQPQSARRIGTPRAAPEPEVVGEVGVDLQPTPRTKRTPRPAAAMQDRTASEPSARVASKSDAMTPKPKPKRTPKPKPIVEQAASGESDAASETVPKPKPRRAPKPKPPPDSSTDPEHQPTPVSDQVPDPDPEPDPDPDPEPEPDPDPDPEPATATATREPIVDQTPVREREPEPVSESTQDRTPERDVAATASPEPDATEQRTARTLPSSRSYRPRVERESPAHRGRRGGRLEPEPPVDVEESPVASDWLVAGSLRFRPTTSEVWAGHNQVNLTPSELAILELLMTSGDRGVTESDIIATGGVEPDGRDIAATIARIRRKTGLAGRGQLVRRERVMVYFLDDEVESGADTRVSHRRGPPSVRR